MNSKFLLTFAVLAVAICGASCYAFADAEESDAATSYTVSFTLTYGGSVSPPQITVPAGTSFSASGNVMTFGSQTVTATPNSGYELTRWYPNNGTVNSDMEIDVYFERSSSSTHTVNLVASPSDKGRLWNTEFGATNINMTIADGGTVVINGDTITGKRPNNTTIASYRAVPLTGNEFTGFSLSNGTYTVTSAMTIYAYFQQSASACEVVIRSVPVGSGAVKLPGSSATLQGTTVVSGSSFYTSGDTITIENVPGSTTEITRGVATPGSGYRFVGWEPSSGTITSSRVIIQAVFEPLITTYTVTIAVSPSNAGTVSMNSITVTSGTTFNTSWQGDSNLVLNIGSATITATRNDGYIFTGWSPSSGTVNSNMTITAVFAVDDTCIVTVTKQPTEGGTVNATPLRVDPGTLFYELSSSTAEEGRMQLGSMLIIATPNEGYAFAGWSPSSGTVNSNMTITALFSEAYTVTFVTDPSEGGTVSDNSVTVSAGTSFSTDNSIMTLGSTTVSALPNIGYVFESWSPSSGTVNSNMTITVTFVESRPYSFWTNDNYNGRIDIIFDFSGNGSQEMIGELFTGTTTAGNADWTSTGYSVKVVVETSGNQTRVGAQLLQGSTVVKTNATGGSWPNVGAWNTFQVSLYPENAQIVFTPVSVLNSFTDYKLYDTQARTMLSWEDVLESSAILTLRHEASGDYPRFSVVNTRVFLDTFNAVLFDPRINVREKFPQYDSVRLNFYSFALYGDSITVNGRTYPVTGDKVTITYIDKDGVHYAVGAVADGEQRTRDFTLSNIYVSWDALTGHCSLTFVDDRWTLNMGTYNNTVVSFAGMWFFYTMLYNSHLSEEKTLGDWKVLPDISQSQMILIYLGILAVAGVAGLVHIRRGGNATLDLVVIGCAGLVGYIMLG